MDKDIVEAGRLFLIEACGQSAEIFNGAGTERQWVARSAARLRPQDRAALLQWLGSARQGSDAQAAGLLNGTLGLAFPAEGWQHPEDPARRGARELLGFLCEGLSSATAPT